jgi:hypothetical protein
MGGRQPLTLDVFDDDRSAVEARAAEVIFRLVADRSHPGGDTSSAALRFWIPEIR